MCAHTFTTGATAHSRKFIAAHNSQPLEFDNFNCRGTEINLLKCSRGIGGTCQHTQDASVICSEYIKLIVRTKIMLLLSNRMFGSQYIPVY